MAHLIAGGNAPIWQQTEGMAEEGMEASVGVWEVMEGGGGIMGRGENNIM